MRLRALGMAIAFFLAGSGLVWAEGDASPQASQAAAPAPAEACAERVAQAVQGHYERIRSLRAAFEQTTRAVSMGLSAGAEESPPARGEVWFAKPGKMRWSYLEPEPSLVVSDGEILWIYDPEAKEAQRFPVGQGFLSGAALQFLFGEGKLLDEFQVKPRAESCQGERVHLELWPRQEATYERLEIWADPESGVIEKTSVVDLLGNVTVVAFRELRFDPELPADIFRFEVPKGVEIIELTPTP